LQKKKEASGEASGDAHENYFVKLIFKSNYVSYNNIFNFWTKKNERGTLNEFLLF